MTDTLSTTDTHSPAAAPRDVKTYHRIKRNLHIADLAIGIAYWAVWLVIASTFTTWLDAHIDSKWAGVALTALVMVGGLAILELPMSYYSGYIIEQRFGLSNQTPRAWLVFQLKAWMVGSIIGAIMLGGLYSLLWYAGTWWSVWLWIGVMTLSVVLAKVFPLLILPLFYPSKPLERPSLTGRMESLASGTGMTLTGVFNLELSKETRKANAMLAGLGSSRRVYLSDTLLDAFTDDEICVVFAHELGHHIRNHIYKGIAITAVVSSLMVALIHWRLNPLAGQPDAWPAAAAGLAQVMLLLSIFPLLTGPVTNAISRRFERQCDSDALRLTNNPAAYRSAFVRLGEINLADPDPPRWEEILFDDHPALSKRIAMADQYVPTAAT